MKRHGKTLQGTRYVPSGNKSQRGFTGRQEVEKNGRTMAVTEFSTNSQLSSMKKLKDNILKNISLKSGEDPRVEYPVLVPTLSSKQVAKVVDKAVNRKGFDFDNDADDRDILTKAKDFAQMRINQMKSPFMESYDIPMGQYADGGYINKMHPKLQGVTKPSKIRKA